MEIETSVKKLRVKMRQFGQKVERNLDEMM